MLLSTISSLFLLASPPLPTPNSAKNATSPANRLSVRLLVPGTSTGTTKLLGLAAAVVGDQQGAVELDEGLLQQVLGMLVDVLLVVGDEGLGDGLADGVDLRSVTTTGDADADVDVGELVEADNQEGLVDLKEAGVLVYAFFSRVVPSSLVVCGRLQYHLPSDSPPILVVFNV